MIVHSLTVPHFLLLLSCVADNALGRTKKYIEVSGRPGPATFLSPAYSNYLDRYNLTYTIESIPPLDEIKLLYRKLMVGIASDALSFRFHFVFIFVSLTLTTRTYKMAKL